MEIEKAIARLSSHSIIPFDDDADEVCDLAIKALKKQISKKPNTDDCCPDCGTYLKDDNCVEGLYCPNCGQKIDWSDADEED